ncbi:MAG: aminotransferase class III-fold pyridoxal phosphate-dependent enzyme [Rhodobacterales bacterium]|nr:aminotransferase class III-fold pyridoxal phosphate-dependent enzyme [Rhodobacterales bacterium]NCT12652.1 aminotransferase class III-fold pyridoxal phosphate-dependent enzyme [Rhodobacterales bacterium]
MRYLAADAPCLPEAAVAEAAARHFGLTGSLRALYSERDQNFRLTEADGTAWTLKIANAADDPATVDLQIAALRHLAATHPALPVPRLRLTLAGDPVARITAPDRTAPDSAAPDGTAPDGTAHLFYALSYIAGDIAANTPATPARLHATGAIIARLGQGLRGFFHPAAGGRALLWDLREAPALRDTLDSLPEAARATLAPLIDHFIADVLPRLPALRAQVIHGDVHEHNLILGPDGSIAGIIDFGDLIHAPLLFDLTGPLSDMLTTPDRIAPVIDAVVAGFHGVTPLEDAEADLAYDLILMRLVFSRLINLWRAAHTPGAANYLADAGFGGGDVLAALLAEGRATVTARIRAACGMEVTAPADLDALIERRRRLMGSHLYVFYDPPLHMVRGQGAWLIDSAGRPFLDCYNNVPILGHCHPHVTEAIARQARRLNTNTRYLGEDILRYGERLTAGLPGDLSVCAFVNSGSEANDIAWRMATLWTGAQGGLVQEFGYHGITAAIDPFSPSASRTGAVAPHMRTLLAPDGYRGIYRDGTPDLGPRYAADADRAIASLAQAGLRPAAYLCDSAFMTNGVLEPQPGYVAGVFERVRAAGGLCVADEVQSGFGRMGTHLWGFAHHGVVPDIITLGKPAGNGHPIGVVITRPEIYERFIRDTAFFSTFGGNNVSCAAGNAVLDVIEREGLVENATRVGAHFKAGLAGLMARHAIVGCVRGTGLALSIELVRDRSTLEPAGAETLRLMNLMRDEGVLTGNEGPHGNIIKIRPPLVMTRDQADIAVAAFDSALGRL